MTEQTPRRMGDYEILGVLGAGGMGRVYKVRNLITDRVEAMKVLLPDLQGHEEVAARFLREIKVLAALRHPNIAPLLTALTVENQLVMIMEYVEGRPISARLAEGAIPPAEALSYIDQVLDALGYAHQQQVVHRDIKPANMMLTQDGTVKLMDFGIARAGQEPAKLTATGSTLGSIAYMSPEQVKGAAVDARSDLYSVGITLYEMVTGEKPFQGDSNFSIMAAHINEAPRPPVELHPDLPEGLNEIILTAIAKAPEHRFQSADAFRNAVGAVLRALQDSQTVFQGSQNTVVASAAARAAMLPTASVVAQRTPAPRAPVPARPATATAPAAVPAQPVTQPPLPPASHRGLYMALGGALVLVLLVGVGMYLPGRDKSSVAAEEGSPPAATTSAAPATPAATEAAPSAAAAATPTRVTPSSENVAKTSPAESVTPVPAAAKPAAQGVRKARIQEEAAVEEEAPADSRSAEAAAQAELDQIEREIDQLATRAAAVNSSLETLQRRQAAAGYGLRGDMVARQSSMNLNLEKAQDAIQRGNAERAKRFAAQAAPDLEALERFLGR